MRVGIDGRLAGRGLGIATALRGLTAELCDLAEVVWIGREGDAPAKVEECLRPPSPYPALDLRPRSGLIRRARLDVIHFAGNTGWMTEGPVPSVLTVHDTIFLRTGVRGRSTRQAVGHRYAGVNVRRAATAASRCTVPSESTARALDEAVPHHAPVQVIPWGVSPPSGWVPAPPSGAPYLLAFAAPDPRKRLDLVVAAWRRLESSLGIELWLLGGAGLTGDQRAELASVGSNGVRLLDYLTPDELWSNLAGALAVVYPSDAEGFGFPVLESMAAGAPVLTGLAPATAELGADAAITIDPKAPVDSIVDGVRRLHFEGGFRDRVVQAGRTRARAFTWARAAAAYLECYEAAIAASR